MPLILIFLHYHLIRLFNQILLTALYSLLGLKSNLDVKKAETVHTTKSGKILNGVVLLNISLGEAKNYDKVEVLQQLNPFVKTDLAKRLTSMTQEQLMDWLQADEMKIKEVYGETKVIYLATFNAAKKWTMPIQNWCLAMNWFTIQFDD